jgi:hypothetical protein
MGFHDVTGTHPTEPPEFFKMYAEGFLPEYIKKKGRTENRKWGAVGERLHRIMKRKAQISGAEVVTTDGETEGLDRRVANEDTCAQMLNACYGAVWQKAGLTYNSGAVAQQSRGFS